MYSGSQHSIVYNELYILRMRRSVEHQNIKSPLNKERKQLLIIYTKSHYSNTHIILSHSLSWKETMRCRRTEITFHSDFKRRTFSFSHTDIYIHGHTQTYTFLPVVSKCSWTITSKRMCWQLRRVVMGSGFKCQVHTKTN